MSAHVAHAQSPLASSASAGTSSTTFDRVLERAGRITFALPFAVFGLFHFSGAQAMAGMVPIPGGVFWVYFTGVALIAGAVGLLSGILGRWAALGLALLMALFAFTVHLPNLGNPQLGQIAMISLLKDLALMGGALTWAARLGRN